MAVLEIPYSPHPKQAQVHSSPARFKVIAAGRRFGKTVLAVNELIKHAVSNPATKDKLTPRSWYVCDTYTHAEMIAWREIQRFLPPELIKRKLNKSLLIELKNGHLIELKGAEEPDRLRGVGLCFVVLDEFGFMRPEAWTDVIRPMLLDTQGGALFIGTPSADGSPHFHDLFKLGQGADSDYSSWLFYTRDNPHIPASEVDKAKKELSPDVFRREFEADFSVAHGLVYDNFRYSIHCIPDYAPSPNDVIVGSIDPGLRNPTAALLAAWTPENECILFKEYYQKEKLADDNAREIKKLVGHEKVAYWVIDRASLKRDPSSGFTVFNNYLEHLKPLVTAPNDKGSVLLGINEVKKLFHVDPRVNRPRIFISRSLTHFVWEIGRYTWYKYARHVERNEKEEPRKLNDHLMDCIRNMVLTKPWLRRRFPAFSHWNNQSGY